MTKVLYGERLGRQGQLRVGCSAVLFDAARERVLLTRRLDNGEWCLPSGGAESGESVSETVEREVFEETNLRVRATRLLGVYSNPNQLVVYADGNKAFFVALSFEVELLGGGLALSNETGDAGFFTLEEMETMPILGNHRQRILDAFKDHPAAFVR